MLVEITAGGKSVIREIVLVSHRGGKGFGPENTLQSLQAALDFGVEMVETDVRMTADGIPVIQHSPFAGLNLISRMEISELQEKAPEIPTLRDYLALAAGRCALNLEIKKCDPGILAEAIDAAGLAYPLLVSSFDGDFLAEYRKTGSTAPLGLLSQYELATERMIREAERCGATTLLPVSFAVKRGLVEAAHAAGLKVITWTVNSSELLGEMVAACVDGVITDAYPESQAFLDALPEKWREAEAIAACGADSP